MKFIGVTILQAVEFPIFLLIFAWALQQCSATALPVMYGVDLIQLIENHGLVPHLYADEREQVYGSCPPSAVSALSTTISKCLDDVVSWASSNRLQLKLPKLK